MSWEAPLALALGMAIPAILLLWMLRPRRPRLRASSLMLWSASPAERQSARPWQRLRSHPLLWLQLLAAALLAVAAARPFLPATETERHLIVLLDASGSMRATDVSPSRFDAARQAVVDLARGLGPGQAMTVIRLDERPRVLVANAESAAPVEEALAAEEPSFGPADVDAAVAVARGIVQGPASWVLVSDGGLTLSDQSRRPAGTSFQLVAVGQEGANVALTGLSARLDDESVTLQVGVRNTGTAPARGSVQLYAEGRLVSAQPWEAPGRGETFLTWSHLAPGPRWYEARLSGLGPASNALDHDDRAWAAVAAPSTPSVLLLSEGNSFLERVLGVHGSLRPFRAAPDDWPALASQGEAYPLTIADRLWPDPMPSGNVLVVGPPAGERFRPENVRPRADHPLLRHVDWSEVHVASASALPVDGSWETVVDSDGGPLLAVREADGRRQAVLAFELSQSDLPLRPAFPVLMANLLDWLLPRPEAAPQLVPPGATLAVEPAPLAERVWVEGVAESGAPDASPVEIAPPWPPRPFVPPGPGLYRVVQEGAEGRQESLVVAGGYHPQESDLAPRAVELPAEEGAPPAPARGATAFWPWLAALALAISLVEWWVDARSR